MLEYFTYQKFKKHRDAKEAGAQEVLDKNDEKYFEGLVENPEAQEVPLQASSADSVQSNSPTGGGSRTPETATPSSSEAGGIPKKHSWKDTVSDYATGTYDKASVYATGTYEKAKQVKLPDVQLPAFLHKKEKDGESSKDKKGKGKGKEEEEYLSNLTDEERELHDALDRLNLAAQDGKAFSLSAETRGILQRFTQILKDMVNGVPTAYDDLVNLFETKQKQIETMFESTPGFLKKLAKQLPSALGLSEKALAAGEGGGSAAGLAAQAATLSIPTLKQLVTKPNAVANALKTVVNAIKLRFPGVVLGTNVILSMALFVLLFVFWYCYKRGKEVRLEKERLEREGEEARIAEAVLQDAPPPPTNDPSVPRTATLNEIVENTQTPAAAVPGGSSTGVGHSTVPREPSVVNPEGKPERQIKNLF